MLHSAMPLLQEMTPGTGPDGANEKAQPA